eukprot:CAMPEP_0115005114 /NCGR_PEP_ID=MMETSP0216-20121206/19660_1 /TAXON_ID=223996 /ORGANISM="Protocruzia adherens, Strain Boccale" /LENGTH=373 /DNA_ID=CAMNT_0002371341 /DNA_START=285 /DNA_END=1406 /DNA_ORIENTATION=+
MEEGTSSKSTDYRVKVQYSNEMIDKVNDSISQGQIKKPRYADSATYKFEIPKDTSKVRVLLIARKNDTEAYDWALKMTQFLFDNKVPEVYSEQHAIQYFREHNQQSVALFDRDRHEKTITFIITIGGDGTLLWSCKLFSTESMPPVLPFSMGSLGFMTNFKCDHYEEVLSELFSHRLIDLDLKMRLECWLENESNGKSEISEDGTYQAFNDVSIERGDSPALSNIECYVNGHFATSIRGDGILLATPNGSTAYNLAAGGSIVHYDVPSILFTPICPHSLSFRPVIFPDSIVFKFKLAENSRSAARVSIDGIGCFELKQDQAVIVRASEWPVPQINPKSTKASNTVEWVNRLRDLLNWNNRGGSDRPLSSKPWN